MNMKKIHRFHPGVYLKDILEAKNISVEELSKSTSISVSTYRNIIGGKEDISESIAISLSKYLDTTKEYWLNLQKQYNEYMKDLIS